MIFHYDVTAGGRPIGHIEAEVERTRAEYTITGRTSLLGVESAERLSLDPSALTVRTSDLRVTMPLAAGGSYGVGARLGFGPSGFQGERQVGRVSWREPAPASGSFAVLPSELSPPYFAVLVERLAALPPDTRLPLYVQAKHLVRSVRLISRTPDLANLEVGGLEVRVRLGREGATGLEIPAQGIKAEPAAEQKLAPVPPLPIAEREITPAARAILTERQVSVERAGARLVGSLAIPAGKGPWPAVLLIGGSGPTDRDEHVGATAVFRDLAAGLAERGIATLRYDKRGVGASGPGTAPVVYRTYRDDAAAMLDLLRGQPEVDKVYALGHSEGGMYALQLGAQGKVTGVISLAGAGEPPDRTLVRQLTFQMKKLGQPADLIAQTRTQMEQALAAVVAHQLPGDKFMGAGGDWWRSVFAVDPAAVAAASKAPVLVLQGASDIQVLPDNAAKLEAAVRKSGQKVEVRLFGGLNHLFTRPGYAGSGEDYELPLAMDPEPIKTIADWIAGRR